MKSYYSLMKITADDPKFDSKRIMKRLNYTCPGKSETLILDFANDAGEIADSFSRYYKTAIISGETELKRQ